MAIFEDHDCLLHVQEEDVIKQFVDSGLFISLRRKFRRMCLISRKHPLTSGYFQSHATCRNEKIRNLVHYFHTVHPFSMFDLYWQFFMFIVFASHFIVIPVDALFPVEHGMGIIFSIKFLVDMLQLMDIIKIFYTGYYNEEKSKVVLKRSTIAKRYLKTYFFFDIISSFNSYCFPFLLLLKKPANHLALSDYYSLLFLRVANRLKIVRIGRWLNILEIFRQYMGYSSYLFKGIRVVLIFIVVTFWSFSITFIIENHTNKMWGQDVPNTNLTYICESYFNATMMLLVVSYGSSINTQNQYISTIFFLCFGFGLQMFLYTQILQVWTKYANAQNKHHSLHKQFKEYMKYKVLPISLRERIFSYFEFKFHKQFFKENDINNIISRS
ncbi:hypothetical protein NQ318_014087 [Aromia moschata]|uniref:Ion transport domain-containing protein n=1 Tax=Aromia moschata TaxID=1265417 RepID=A0AAV8Z0Z9_9CUCU|nr:hypothetical protein NQ318_014087 [Aromia moschata]